MAADVAQNDTKSKQGRRDGGARPALYIAMIVGVVLAAYIGKSASTGIFSCSARGYSADDYLAYCGAAGYGDYEHGAFWFDLEPAARRYAANADVMMLGNSRLQQGFSTASTERWFASASLRYYLLGFAYWENAIFEGPLLQKVKPRAKVYVINIDGFFDEAESEPAKIVMDSRTAVLKYAVKHAWQLVHQPVCGNISVLCGDDPGLFRSRQTGAWHTDGVPPYTGKPVSYAKGIDAEFVAHYTAAGDKFLAHLAPQRSCIIFTIVPTVDTKLDTAKAIAAALGVGFVAPALDGLGTSDGSHLDKSSAERWSAAFFQAAAPQIRRCLLTETASHS